MNRKNEPQTLGDAIKEFLDQFKNNDRLLESKAITAWSAVMGPNISKYTQELHFKKGKLYVSLSSPVLKNELVMYRRKIVNSLNQYIGIEIVTDVVIR
ncbi:MAG TPA: DUF721 domain-containing protein [Tenuifilaceae bacterium]|nr:DUF721 domain-containing protein [Tenuifilaceae bacterium]HPE17972.1 DUF721 domain-containing protein [Tenuifilaceae bacterium]HPJ44906.1 DUF721 domain-containing protein [Tenuifilaceae bacterium]HPQ33128.1 DUF721 domain-containing protein [Tenuifilaceae bacterium]HRX67060.1 DUF721 domain-containing protein [Tenuifilaceae bacterium]